MATGTGNLPYPGKVYNPFDILTAEELNEDVANIESLANGTGLGDLSVPSSAINLSKTVDGNGWTVYDFGNFKQYCKITGPHTVPSTASLTENPIATSQNMPVGVSASMVYMNIQLSQATSAARTRYFPGTDLSSASTNTSATYTIYVRNLTSATLTDSDLYITQNLITR